MKKKKTKKKRKKKNRLDSFDFLGKKQKSNTAGAFCIFLFCFFVCLINLNSLMRESLFLFFFAFVDFLTADEFSAELASGVAYVAGQDDVGRPVVVRGTKILKQNSS